MTTPNIPLLRKAVEWVESQAHLPWWQSEWDQSGWVHQGEERTRQAHLTGDAPLSHTCGTAYCVAGYIGQLADPRYAKDDWVGDQHVASFAQRELGITTDQAEELFMASNNAEDIRRIAEDIAGGAL